MVNTVQPLAAGAVVAPGNVPAMPSYAVQGSNSAHEAVPADTHQAVVSLIVITGTSIDNYGKKALRAVVGFEIPAHVREFNNIVKPAMVLKEMPLMFGGRANFGKIARAALKRDVTPADNIDVFSLIGTNVALTITHNDNGYEKISEIAPLMAGVPELAAATPFGWVFSPAGCDDKGNPVFPDAVFLPSWVSQRIQESDEYAAAYGLVAKPQAVAAAPQNLASIPLAMPQVAQQPPVQQVPAPVQQMPAPVQQMAAPVPAQVPAPVPAPVQQMAAPAPVQQMAPPAQDQIPGVEMPAPQMVDPAGVAAQPAPLPVPGAQPQVAEVPVTVAATDPSATQNLPPEIQAQLAQIHGNTGA